MIGRHFILLSFLTLSLQIEVVRSRELKIVFSFQVFGAIQVCMGVSVHSNLTPWMFVKL